MKQNPTNTTKHLRDAALAAHVRSEQWATYWTAHADAIRAVEPYDRGRYRRLVNRLLSLVVSGDTAGQTAVGDDDTMPWELDDQPSPHDSKTQARCLLPLLAIPGVITADRPPAQSRVLSSKETLSTALGTDGNVDILSL